jgi:dienelactone hydrolase
MVGTTFVSPASAELFVDLSFGVSETKNIQYTTGLDGKGKSVPLRLDLYQPTGAGLPAKLPAVVLMHGGYFTSGDKSDMAIMSRIFASAGYVTVAIDYRKLNLLPPPPATPLNFPPERYPEWLPGELASAGLTIQQYANTVAAAVADEGAAVNWLAANAATYNIDPNMIAVGGHSAGAVSSLLLGAGAVDGVKANVGAVISAAGGMFGLETFVNPGDPGVFSIHGTADTTVPYSELGFLTKAMDAAGVNHQELILPGQGHSISEIDLILNLQPMLRFTINELRAVPEPSTITLAAIGVLSVLTAMRRGKKKQAA